MTFEDEDEDEKEYNLSAKSKKGWQRMTRAWRRFVKTKTMRDWIRVQEAAARLDLDALEHFYAR